MAKIAVLGGFGNIGSGVTSLLINNANLITTNAGQDISIKYVVDVVEPKEDNIYNGAVTKNFDDVENDPEIKIVVETIGGTRIAYNYTKRALMAGKSVVTSNKELVAEHGMELTRIAKEHHAAYLFEAAVGGGIPLLYPLSNCFAANHITEIHGILNGTTNYILTRMACSHMDFDTALAEAKEKGYAEPNSVADIEGFDACRKICILADIVYGMNVSPDKVHTEGISGIAYNDLSFAAKNNYSIKLLGRVVKREDGKIDILTAPHLVSNEEPVAGVNGVFNGVCVIGDAVDKVMFYGRGAGKKPTASAVVSDIVDIVLHGAENCCISWDEAGENYICDAMDMEYAHYIRLAADDYSKLNTLYPKAEKLGGTEDETACLLPIEKTSDTNKKLAEAGIKPLSFIRVL